MITGLKQFRGREQFCYKRLNPSHGCVYAILTEVKDIILTQECRQEVRGLISWENKSKFLRRKFQRQNC